MIQYWEIAELAALETPAKAIIAALPSSGVITFMGEMGSGKTTFISVLCKNLGVKTPVSSPTYSLVNTYTTETGQTIYHLDLYRLETEEELLNAGIEELFFEDAIIMIEWPQLALNYLPASRMEITLSVTEHQLRKISMQLL